MAAPDRLERLRAQKVVTGIDFVYVYKDQVRLDVFFLRPPETLNAPLVDPNTKKPDVNPDQVRIYSSSGDERAPQVPVVKVSGAVKDGRYVLRLTTSEPGGFSPYRLRLDDPRIDPYYNDVAFSFKAHCDSELDCERPEHECPPEAEIDFPGG